MVDRASSPVSFRLVRDTSDSVRIRPDIRQSGALVGVAVVWVVFVVLPAGRLGEADAVLAAAGVLGALVQRRKGITLTLDAAVVHSFRTRRIPWADVQAVTIEPHFRGEAVTLWTVDRRRIPLWAPRRVSRWENPHLEEQWRTIGDWWVAHRGLAWRPGYGSDSAGVGPGW
jgi:hypothetical protein